MKESEILTSIKRNVPLFCPKVVYMDRLQAGKRQFEGRWIQMCKAGTPDLYCIINYDGGHLLFIECKTKKGKQTDNQKVFEHMVMDFTHIHYVVARSYKDVVKFIRDLTTT